MTTEIRNGNERFATKDAYNGETVSKKRYVIVASSYDKRGRLIYSCTNSYNDSSSLMRYYAMKLGQPHRVRNHAEVRCLEVSVLKMKRKVDTIVVMRFDNEGQLKNAKPCNICEYALRTDFNIRRVLYSTENGMQEL